MRLQWDAAQPLSSGQRLELDEAYADMLATFTDSYSCPYVAVARFDHRIIGAVYGGIGGELVIAWAVEHDEPATDMALVAEENIALFQGSGPEQFLVSKEELHEYLGEAA